MRQSGIGPSGKPGWSSDIDPCHVLRSLMIEASRCKPDLRTDGAIALRVLRALDDPSVSDAALARLVQAEPVLAARLVAVANSFAFRGSGRTVGDVRSALSRLGFGTVRSIAASALVRQIGTGAAPGSAALGMAARLWAHTAHVAALARALARRVTRVDPEVAMFAGIVHEIGGFYLLSRSADFPGLFDGDPAAWNEEEALDLEHQLGRVVLRALAIPEPVMAAVEESWQGFLALPPRTLGDTLLLAEDLAPVATPFHEPPDPVQEGGEDRAAAASIEIVLGQATLSAILRESAEEVESLADALNT